MMKAFRQGDTARQVEARETADWRKRGSYIVEASIVLPIFMVAMIVLSAIVLFYASVEDANYVMATELRKGAIEAIGTKAQPLLPITIKERISENHPIVKSQRVKEYGFRKTRDGMDELIYIKLELYMKSNNPMGFLSEARYDASLMTRAYVGLKREADPMSEAEFRNELADEVYVFPQDGKRYHNKNCSYVHAESKVVVLTDELRKKYSVCSVCKSKTVKNGSSVYIFPNYGENYHIAGCGVLRRRNIEIEKKTAIKRGYTPCSKCGG